MKYFYMAVCVEQNKNENIFSESKNKEYIPGYCAYLVKFSESDNLKSVLDSIGNLKYCNVFETKKKAQNVVNDWNKSYKENGNHLFYK